MYNLTFLIPSHFVDYDLKKPMGPANIGGGVALKYARVEEAGPPEFNCVRIGSTNDIKPDDVVFVDWMWFCITRDESEGIVDRVKQFVEIPNPKIIYGSEFCVASVPYKTIVPAIESANMVLHNSDLLRKLYRTIGIYNSRFLSDPVPPIFSPVMNKKPRIICMGQISEAKNTEAVITIFEGLRGTGIERYFLGGISLWGEKELEYKWAIDLQNEIEAVSDVFLENVSQSEVTKACNMATFYAHFAIHDMSSFAGQENMSAGNIVFGLRHPICQERTSYWFNTPEELAEAIKRYDLESDIYQKDVDKTLEIAGQWSYESWQIQMSDILERLKWSIQ